MFVNGYKLGKVMSVGMFITWGTIGITGVIHAGAKVSIVKVLVLMVESKVVGNLLAHDQTMPGRRIVLSLVEVRIIYFGRSLIYMRGSSDPNLSYAQPAGSAIGSITGFYTAASGSTGAWIGGAGYFGQLHHTRLIPITDCFIQISIPGGVYIVADFQGEWVAGACLMILSP